MSKVDSLVYDDEDLEDQEGEANKDESEDLTTSVSYNESISDIMGALFGGSNVSVDGNSHSNVSREDRGETSDQEGNSGVEGSELGFDG